MGKVHLADILEERKAIKLRQNGSTPLKQMDHPMKKKTSPQCYVILVFTLHLLKILLFRLGIEFWGKLGKHQELSISSLLLKSNAISACHKDAE